RFFFIRYSPIDQFGNLRMRELAQNFAFTFESFATGRPGQGEMDELDRDFTLEPAITALCQPDTAHASAADHFEHAIMRDNLTDKRPRWWSFHFICQVARKYFHRVLSKEISCSAVGSQKRLDLSNQIGIARTGFLQEFVAALWRNFESRLQQVIYDFPSLCVHDANQSALPASCADTPP